MIILIKYSCNFIGIEVLSYGDQKNTNILKIRKQFENIIQPMEEMAAKKLKQQFGEIFDNTRQVTNSL